MQKQKTTQKYYSFLKDLYRLAKQNEPVKVGQLIKQHRIGNGIAISMNNLGIIKSEYKGPGIGTNITWLGKRPTLEMADLVRKRIGFDANGKEPAMEKVHSTRQTAARAAEGVNRQEIVNLQQQDLPLEPVQEQECIVMPKRATITIQNNGSTLSCQSNVSSGVLTFEVNGAKVEVALN